LNPEEPVRDVMRRTMFNLDLIQRQETPSGPFYVTQLVNSFLGALAHPWERFKKELRTIPIAEALAQGWPEIAKERMTDSEPKHLCELLRVMRNGIAHGNIVFLPNEKDEIRAIRVWNNDPKGHRTWGAILTVEVMRSMLDRFVELAEQLHQHRGELKRQMA
jgi:hypothetical protein